MKEFQYNTFGFHCPNCGMKHGGYYRSNFVKENKYSLIKICDNCKCSIKVKLIPTSNDFTLSVKQSCNLITE